MARGQGSIEYLFVLGVLIVAGLVVLGLLAGLDVRTEKITREQSAEYWHGAEIGIINHSANSSGVYLTVRNNLPFKVIVDEVSLIGRQGRICTKSPVLEMVPGQETPIVLDAIPCDAGAEYSYTVQFVYSEPTSGRMFVFVGKAPLVGVCGG
ncbi:MAG: hypothetical protein N3H30_01300 [Candidatus Micrarchaeota archaeon]|nr:hypothetical protein [Candidatus Micrarchaeota archaeon]